MKFITSAIFTLQLLTTSAQQGAPTLQISKLDNVRGDVITSQVFSQLGMGLAKAEQIQSNGQVLTTESGVSSGSGNEHSTSGTETQNTGNPKTKSESPAKPDLAPEAKGV
jgi:hypothetical protein